MVLNTWLHVRIMWKLLKDDPSLDYALPVYLWVILPLNFCAILAFPIASPTLSPNPLRVAVLSSLSLLVALLWLTSSPGSRPLELPYLGLPQIGGGGQRWQPENRLGAVRSERGLAFSGGETSSGNWHCSYTLGEVKSPLERKGMGARYGSGV